MSQRNRPGFSPIEPPKNHGEAAKAFAQSLGSTLPVLGDTHRHVAEPLPINAIYPDPAQPRRIIPSAVRHSTIVEPRTIGTILQNWVVRAREESGFTVDQVNQFLVGEDTGDLALSINQESTPITYGLVDLLALASSIHRDGLANPITAARHGGREYLIETGERRWMAYHLLHALTGEDRYQRIPARIVSFDVWRQAAENAARTQLNAIGKARQLARLLMDVYKGEYQFDSFGDLVQPGSVDQPYYAQVADGNQFRIPRNTGQKFLDALGEKSPQRLVEYRRLLRIPPEMWSQCDEENWPLDRILKDLRPEKPAIPNGSVGYRPSDEPIPYGSVRYSTQEPATDPVGTASKNSSYYPPKFMPGQRVYVPERRMFGEVEGINSRDGVWRYQLDSIPGQWAEHDLALFWEEDAPPASSPSPSGREGQGGEAVQGEVSGEVKKNPLTAHSYTDHLNNYLREREERQAAAQALIEEKYRYAGLTEEEIASGHWVPLTKDDSDYRVTNLITREVRPDTGDPLPDGVPFMPARPAWKAPAINTRKDGDTQVNHEYALKRILAVRTPAEAFLQNGDVSIVLELDDPVRIQELRDLLESVAVRAMNLWSQLVTDNTAPPDDLIDAAEALYARFYQSGDES